MPVIEISYLVIDKVKKFLPTGTKISPTQIVRVALLCLKQSNLDDNEIYSLIGQCGTDLELIDSLEAKK